MSKLSRNLFNILILIGSILIYMLLIKYQFLKVNSSFEKSDHFNIITINSILAGFLFTGLGIFISSLNKTRIQRLENGGYLDKYYTTIYIAISLNIASIVAAVIIIFVDKKYSYQLLLIEQMSLMVSIIFFVKCMVGLRKIISMIRKSD